MLGTATIIKIKTDGQRVRSEDGLSKGRERVEHAVKYSTGKDTHKNSC